MSTLSRKKKWAAFIIMFHLIKEEEKKRKKTRRYWIKSLFVKRKEEGVGRLLNALPVDESIGQYKNFARMSVEDFEILVNLIRPKIEKQDTNFRECISVKERLAVTLHFLATGDSYTSLQYLFKMSKQSLSLIIPEVCNALIETLKDYIKRPRTFEDWLKVAQDFETLWHFPNCLGAMNSKHIILQAPYNNGSEYYNSKGFYSIILFAVIDAQYNFLFADVGCQGRISNTEVLQNSELYRRITKKTLKLPPPKPLPENQKDIPYVFVADKTFPLTECIMKPYAGNHPKDSKEAIFNYRLSQAQRVVENSFEIITSVFGVLRKPLLLQPEKAQVVVMAIMCLHNYLRNSKTSQNKYIPPGTLDREVERRLAEERLRSLQSTDTLQDTRNVLHRGSVEAKRIRNEFATYFTTTGEIP